MTSLPHPRVTHRKKGFTLVELLTVIAVIGILAAIIIPSVNIAFVNVKKAQTKAFMNQLALAIENYRITYGYYPTFNGEIVVTGDDSIFVMEEDDDTNVLLQTLTGSGYDGTAITDAEAAVMNPKKRRFFTVSQNDFALDLVSGGRSRMLGDAFDNTDIVIVMDRNKDGILPTALFGTTVTSADSAAEVAPTVTSNIFAGVAIYTAGTGDEILATWE